MGENVMDIVKLIVGSVVVIAAAYYTTYFIATRKAGGQQTGRRTITARDRFALTKDKSICVVEIKDTVYIVAMGANGATLLDKIPLEEFGEAGQAGAAGFPKGLSEGFGRIKKSFSPAGNGEVKTAGRRRAEPFRDGTGESGPETADEPAEANEAAEKPTARLLDLFADDDVTFGAPPPEQGTAKEELKPVSGTEKPDDRIHERRLSERRRLGRRHTDEPDAPVLKMAQEEDELDIVFRKLLTRRAAAGMRSAPPEEGGS